MSDTERSASQWKEEFIAKIKGVTDSYEELSSHLGTVDEIQGSVDAEEISGFILMKLFKMGKDIEKVFG